MKQTLFLYHSRAIGRLLFNHMDAWGSTLIITTLALLLHDALNRQTGYLIAALTVGYWLAFALNDYYDAPYDATDPRKAHRNFFVQHKAHPFVVKLVGGLTGAFLLFVFSSFGWRGVVTLLLSLFVTWAYSAPPFRLKNHPGLDLLVHALFVETFPYFTCLLLTHGTWTRLDVVLLTILFLASSAAQLEQQLRDFHLDAHTGRTFATVVGQGKTLLLLRATTGLLMVVSAINVLNRTIPPFVAAYGVIGLPALAHRFLRKRSKARSEKLVYLSALTGLLYMGLILIFYVARS